jgi:type VI secretion system protein ImpK
MDRITEITEPVFSAVLQIQRLDPGVMPMADQIHQQMCGYLDRCTREGTRLGVPHAELEEIRYALAALADEVVLGKGGALRESWLTRLLQLKYFGQNVAGDVFFERLSTLRRDPTRIEVLKVYYLCLMLGFRGKYRVRGGELELLDIIDAVRNELVLARIIPTEGVLSPQGARPHEPSADHRRNLLVTWFALAAAASSALLYLWLRLSLAERAEQLVQRLSSLTGA